MKKIILILSAACCLGFLQSCITSLQPLVTLETITNDQRITGSWTSDGDVYTITPLPQSWYGKEMQKQVINSEKPKPLSAGEKRDSLLASKMYVVSFTKNGIGHYMAARLIKLNGQLFADLYPVAIDDNGKNKDQSDAFAMNQNYLPGFTIARVEVASNSLTLKFIDGDFIASQIKAGRMKLKHESNELFGSFLITASTEELQQFVLKYGGDERLFNKNSAVTLTRKAVNL